MHKCHSLLISGDSITKTGGIISLSGALLLAIYAKKQKVPVICISRNYCLSDKVMLD